MEQKGIRFLVNGGSLGWRVGDNNTSNTDSSDTMESVSSRTHHGSFVKPPPPHTHTHLLRQMATGSVALIYTHGIDLKYNGLFRLTIHVSTKYTTASNSKYTSVRYFLIPFSSQQNIRKPFSFYKDINGAQEIGQGITRHFFPKE